MTDSDVQTGEWKVPRGVVWFYQASHRGHIRSLDHDTKGRHYEGTVLTPREDGDGYLVANVAREDGTRWNGVSVARLVLLAHDPDGYAEGMQACHGPGGQKDNRWPENLRWGTDEQNRADWRRDNPPRPKPLKECPRCGTQHDGKGRNCHACVVELGVRGARLLADRVPLQEAADQLGYPPVALHNLAVKYGHLVCSVESAAPRDTQSRLRRVIFRREASRANSDAP
jgi:hypothetical protein